MVAFDTGFLLLLLRPGVPPPVDPVTGAPVAFAKERIEGLVVDLDRRRRKIIVPTPALAELLVRAGRAGPEYVSRLSGQARFRIEPFDELAALEVAQRLHDVTSKRSRVDQRAAGTWGKIKFDWQIVAIAKVRGAKFVYTTDTDVVKYAGQVGMTPVQLHEVPVPESARQQDLFYGGEASAQSGNDV